MKNDAELGLLQGKLHHQQSDLNYFYSENSKLQSDFDASLSNINRLERELNELLDNKRRILTKMQEVEGLSCGAGSRMGNIQFIRQGQLEGRFLERMQSRIIEQQQKQQKTVEMIKDNIQKLKGKSLAIEDEIENERQHMMYIDGLISQNRAHIEQKKIMIAQLEGSIRTLS